MKYSAAAIERLGIPAYNWWSECNHGVARMGRATVFPQPIGMASSFNEKLLFDVATAISDEARANYNQFKKFGIFTNLLLKDIIIHVFLTSVQAGVEGLPEKRQFLRAF